jgi:hypothetical protein
MLGTEDAPALDGAGQLDVLQVGHGVYLLLVVITCDLSW